jgi:hypothetical protein
VKRYSKYNFADHEQMIDYKKYWSGDNLRKIVAGADTGTPEGWNRVEILREILKNMHFEM